MLEVEIIKNVLIVAMGAGVITSAIIQKIKENMETKKYLFIISLIVSFATGSLFAFTFSNLAPAYCLWCGLLTVAGAEAIYKAFEGKVFKSFCELCEESKKEEKEPERIER